MYLVSDSGAVFSKKVGRRLKPFRNAKGYLVVYLTSGIRTRQVHRLVAECFIRPPRTGEVINHKNFRRADNRAKNLEWCTSEQNTKYSVIHARFPRGESSWKSKLRARDVLKIRAMRGSISQSEIAARFGVTKSTVGHIQTRRTWRHLP
jgi:DNA-binding transcriptional regulator YiaG